MMKANVCKKKDKCRDEGSLINYWGVDGLTTYKEIIFCKNFSIQFQKMAFEPDIRIFK